ncbi:MAG: phospholipid carrier-dependent glycosyltransferase [Deltaproteobacteria bacterium]|nr:phospholipid carrier-dependent glycosyltransferase [Deltaproteobacteria bacterium]
MTGPRQPPPPWAVWLALGALALALRVAALGSQPLLGDDLSVGRTALNFAELGWPEPTMWNHPRLRDLLVHASLELLGDGPWGLKLWSVLLGTLAVPATALLVRALTGSLAAAALAGLLVATDPLHLDFSRQAINDVYLSFLPVASILALLRYRARRAPGWLALAGLVLGLAVATKWSAAFPVGAAAAVVLAGSLRAEASRRGRAAELCLFGAALVALPGAVYLLTYWPWFGRGHDLAELLRFHLAMARETATHTGYAGTKLPGYPGEVVGAWRWFLQPIWYVDYIQPMAGRPGIPEGGFFLPAVANPLAWLAALPATAWAGWRWLRARDPGAGWLALLFLAAWLPFALVPRPIWTNSALAVVPFAMAPVAWAAARLHQRFPLPVRAWGAAALLVAALLCPPAMGLSLAPSDGLVRALVAPAALDPASHGDP